MKTTRTILPLLLLLAFSFSACKPENLDIYPDELGGTYRAVAAASVADLLSCVAVPGGVNSTVPQLRLETTASGGVTLSYQPAGQGILSEKSLPLSSTFKDGVIELAYQGRNIGDYRVGTMQEGSKERKAKILSLMISLPNEQLLVQFRGVKE